ncbi:hypothetical protein Y032_0132g1711 [Ancylostoma ceylanicum]|uniref:Uncharacterized protein n=1 Tax=Ancylostoma ceylanicum TaxID=53326 RepID=A0A016T6T2_9BILA|nr:hypothetical protein Y032_0132g1711 [Ancylostoma ceylanicum]
MWFQPCLDKAGSSFCIKPFEQGMCHHEALKELMQEDNTREYDKTSYSSSRSNFLAPGNASGWDCTH